MTGEAIGILPEGRFEDLLPGSVGLGEAAMALVSETRFGEFFVGVAEPPCPGGIVRQEEEQKSGADHSDESLDYEQPAEPLKTVVAVHVPNAIGNAATKGARQGGMGDDESNSKGTLFGAVPERDVVDDAWKEPGLNDFVRKCLRA